MTLNFEPGRGFGVYVHWPWCAKVCPYCDFNVYAAKGRDPAPLLEAMAADLGAWRQRTGPRRVDTLFLGGGTPSLMPPSGVEALIAAVDKLWGFSEDPEITLEANPDDATAFEDLVAAGVNRLSLGVQSLNDQSLQFLGRNHDAAAARAAIAIAGQLSAGLSIDMIYALPDQLVAAWTAELKEVLDVAAPHLSLYELTIAGGTAFERAVARGAWRPADDDRAADLYEATQEITAAAGFPAYEISNHAHSDRDRGRHNLIYWRSGDWLGIGPGAHGRVTLDGARWAVEASKRPDAYIDDVQQGRLDMHALSQADVAKERLIMGLRVVDGVAREDIAALGVVLDPTALDELAASGHLTNNSNRLALTPSGRLLADHIAGRLLAAAD